MRQQLALLALLLPILLRGQQLTCEDEFLLSGSATLQGECIRMTSNTTGQLGCAWFHLETDFSMPFSNSMTVNFGNNDNNGADGICLVYQSNNNTICGISGEGIGAQGIPNSFIVEFDTFQNGGLGDPFNDHAGININGDFTNSIEGPIDLGNIEDGIDHNITFNWDPATNSYEVLFDGTLIMSGNFDIINNCFGGSPFAYWGYTSSTGGFTNEQLVCPGLPPEVIADAGVTPFELPCFGALGMLDGSNSDQGPEFTYEWTTNDGNIVSGASTINPMIDAAGTYTLTVFNTLTLCENTDQITVTTNELEALIDLPPFLDCFTGEVTLSGASSTSGTDIAYEWTTTDGNIIDENGNEATVDQPGTYTLTVIYDNGVCEEQTSVLVEEDPDVPLAFAQDEIIRCDPPNVELNGTGSSESAVFSYEWTTSDGLILAGENTLFPLVGAEGMYTLMVTNIFTGCSDEYDVFVTADQNLPDAIAIVNDDLGCGGASLTIDGSLSSFGNQISYEWTTTNGNIVSGTNEQSPVVDQAGDYTLLVTNTDNGCTDQTTVTVNGGGNNVNATVIVPEELTCQTNSVQLDGGGSVPITGVTYLWTTPGGQIDTDSSLPQVNVSAQGTYTLIVTETITGCADTVAVEVTQDVVLPIAEAGTAQLFNCVDTNQQLDATGSSTGAFTYNWTSADGTILSGQNTLMPQVASAGTYTLEVTNTQNGCSSTDVVTVQADSNTPVVQIALSDTLDCTTNSLTLNALGSSFGAGLTTSWSTTDGNFVTGTDGLQPIIDQAGTYSLTIVDDGNGCSETASVMVVQDTLLPNVQIALPDTLNCALTTLSIDASGSSAGGAFSYNWTTVDGVINSATDTLFATVSEPGSYVFTAVNNQNHCQDSATIVVFEDILTPDLNITIPAPLNCTQTSLTLQASLAENIPLTSYDWSTADGNIVSGVNGLQPVINNAGTYQLIALNTQNQCADTASVVVMADITPPQADAGPDRLLNCITLSETIGGNSSSGNTFAYRWTSPDASINSEDTLANLITTVPGVFVLEVTNTNNTCIALDTVVVAQDVVPPVAVVDIPPLLTCTDSLSLLDGSGSTGTTNLGFAWSAISGSLVGDPVANQLNASQAGIYQLIVTATGNGCTDTSTVEVLQDDNFPTAMIALPAELNCERLDLNLVGTANSTSGNTNFSWSTLDGNIVAAANTLQPLIDQPGTYTLKVEDSNNNCQAQAQVVVALDTLAPLAVAGPDTMLNCVRMLVILDAGSSSQGEAISYTWSTTDGNILNGALSSAPQVDAPGWYVLEVYNAVNGCRAVDQVLVDIDTIAPIIQVIPPISLTCLDTLATLDASASITTGLAQYVWTSIDGHAITNANTAQATVTLSGTYELELTNLSNGCVRTSAVEVLEDLVAPVPNIATPGLLTCQVTSQVLNATASTGDALSFTWMSTDGSILNDANTATPTITTPGQYDVVITDGSNGCTTSASVQVASDTELPLVAITDAPGIDCNTPEVTLEAFVGGNIGTAPEYQWASTDGNIVANNMSLMPRVDAEGSYVLAVTNTNNDCVNYDTVFVRANLEPPFISFTAADRLDCFNSTVNLDAGGSTGNASLGFAWNSPNGNIISSTNEALITVDVPGNYGLLLTNLANGCTDSLGLIVTQDTIAPFISILSPNILDCATTSIVIDASDSDNGNGFTLNWETLNGQIDSGADSPAPTISEPGLYTLSVQNTDNGCTNEGSVEVEQDEELPSIVFAEPARLTCTVNSLILDATQSSVGPTLTYNWTTSNGQILNGENGLTPEIGAPGEYLLVITDNSNGCLNEAVLPVAEDIVAPVAEAGADFTLDCLSDVGFLNGTGSSQGSTFTFFWSTTEGSLLEGEDSLNPSINAPGTYQLQVTNTENGCVTLDDVVVIQNLPVGAVELTQPLCFGDAGMISFTNVEGGTPPYVYTINAGSSAQFEPAFFDVVAGLYTAQVEDSNGCIYTETVELVQPDSLVVIFTETDLEVTYGDSIRLLVQSNYPATDLAQIIWDNASTLSCNDCLRPYASPTESGFYRLTVITENGCRDEALASVLVKRDFPVYFPSAFSPDGDGNNDVFYPYSRLGAVNEVRKFIIFDRWGNEVYAMNSFPPNDPSYGWDGTQRGLDHNTGVFVYTAEVELADGRIEIFKGDVTLVR